MAEADSSAREFERELIAESDTYNAVKRVEINSRLGLHEGQWFRLCSSVHGIDDAPAHVIRLQFERDGSETAVIDYCYNDDSLPIRNASLVARRRAMVAVDTEGNPLTSDPEQA